MGRSNDAYPQVISTETSVDSVAVKNRQRSKIDDVDGIEKALELAALSLRPDELSARQLINRLMPHLFSMRAKGFSFIQLTKVLNDAIGRSDVKLSPATVKSYYNEFIAKKNDECEEHLKQSLKIIEQVNKLTAKSPEQLIAEAAALKSATSARRDTTAAVNRVFAQQKISTPPNIYRTEISPPSATVSPTAEKTERPAAQAQPVAATPVVSRLASEMGLGDLPIPSEFSSTGYAPAEKDAPPSSHTSVELPVPTGSDAPTYSCICLTNPSESEMHPSTADTFENAPQLFFSDAVLEHPDIPGLMLTNGQRRCSSRLKYSMNGVEMLEDVKQVRNRYRWKPGIKETPSRTSKDHVEIDLSLFPKPSD